MTKSKDYRAIVLPDKYVPKKTEEYMSAEQKAYFYKLLSTEKAEQEQELADFDASPNLGQKMDSLGAMDEGDAATLSVDADMGIKMQDRNAKYLRHIDAALQRLENGTYGYSVISGDEIGLKRLMANPIATTTCEEKESNE